MFEKYSFFSPILYGVEFFPYNWKIGVRKKKFFPDPNFPIIWKKTLPHTKWGKRKNIFQIYFTPFWVPDPDRLEVGDNHTVRNSKVTNNTL